MKIWRGYGSEHSHNLVMIGRFSSFEDAEKTKVIIDMLAERLPDLIELDSPSERFEDGVLELLKGQEFTSLSRREVDQFLYDVNTKLEDDTIILTTEEIDVSAFLKLMISRGAKVEVYSAHDFPDSGYGRGA